jgi:glycosyltransferase involved in cell wall biosynthesis
VSEEETPAASAARGGHDSSRRVARLQVSVVVPVRDEEASVPSLVEALKRQTHQPAEVVIVNGGSTDRTAEVVRQLTAGDERFRLLDAGAGTPGRNRNLGAEAAA